MRTSMVSARIFGIDSGLARHLHQVAGAETVSAAFIDSGLPEVSVDAPDVFMPMRCLYRLFEFFARECGDQNFSLAFHDAVRIEDWGPWGNYILSAKTLAEALQRLQMVAPYQINLDKVSLEADSDEVLICYERGSHVSIGYRHYALGVVFAILNICRHFLGSDWTARRMELDFPRPKNSAQFEDVFECPVVFGRARIAIGVLREECSQRPLQASDGPCVTLSDIHRRMIEAPKDFVSTVRETIRLQQLERPVDIDAVGACLSVGPRTLQRRLSDEGVTFRELVSHVRAERATELLRGTDVPILEIAGELGYSSTSHFSRAFQRTTGARPSDLRNRVANG